jgi:hypothetical protein
MIRETRVASIGLACLALAGALSAQQPLGPELQINTYTANDQRDPRIAVGSDGRFVVAWSSYGSAGSDQHRTSVQIRRFTAGASPLGPEFQANEEISSYQRPKSVLPADDGEFTVVWGSHFSSPDAPSASGSARRFDGNGTPVAPEFVVADVQAYAGSPTAAGRPNGAFVVARTLDYDDIEVSRYSGAGVHLGTFELSRAGHSLGDPSLDMAPDGSFVVAWSDVDDTAYPATVSDIRLRRFHSTGAPAGQVVDVTGPATPGTRHSPRVARNGTGDLLVVWADDASPGTDASGFSIQARLFDAVGNPLGGQIQVNEGTLGDQRSPDVAAAPDGSFVVAWSDDPVGVPGAGDGSDLGVRARHLADDGTPLASSFAVNSITAGAQFGPSLAVASNGDLLLTWASEASTGSDSAGMSVQLRRFRPALFADGFESGDVLRWTSGGD